MGESLTGKLEYMNILEEIQELHQSNTSCLF